MGNESAPVTGLTDWRPLPPKHDRALRARLFPRRSRLWSAGATQAPRPTGLSGQFLNRFPENVLILPRFLHHCNADAASQSLGQGPARGQIRKYATSIHETHTSLRYKDTETQSRSKPRGKPRDHACPHIFKHI